MGDGRVALILDIATLTRERRHGASRTLHRHVFNVNATANAS
jgi:chemotaxis protein histidine kinase CheA